MLLATVTRVALGLGDPGLVIMLVGLVALGVSFIPRPAPDADAPAPLSFADKLQGIFLEPTRVFQNLRPHPIWVGGFLVIALFSLAYQVAFTQRVTPERIVTKTVDNLVERGRLTAEEAPAMRERQIERAKYPFRQYGVYASQVAGLFILMIFLALLYLLCVTMVGGDINYWQALSVAVYASLPPVVITGVLNLILLFIQSSDEIDVIRGQRGLVRADLSLFFSPVSNPLLYTVASFLGLFTIYGWWLTTKGLQNTGARVSTAAAWGIVILLWALGVGVVAFASSLVPGIV
jgi:hypothetical protein